jgi:hypothetical protein
MTINPKNVFLWLWKSKSHEVWKWETTKLNPFILYEEFETYICKFPLSNLGTNNLIEKKKSRMKTIMSNVIVECIIEKIS